MDDALIGMLQGIFGSNFLNGAQGLVQSAAHYNETAWTFALAISENAVKPAATTIVSIVMVLELVRVALKVEGDNKLQLQLIAKVLIKTAFIVAILQNATTILGAIGEVGDYLIKKIIEMAPGGTTTSSLPENIRQAAEDMNPLAQIGLMAILLIPWLIAMVASLALRLVVLIRFAELYVLTTMAPLSMSFLSYEETKHIGIGYLKRYGTVVLHGVAIVICIAIYGAFQIGATGLNDIDTSTELFTLITVHPVELIIGPVFFAFLIFKSGQVARAMFGD